MNFGRIPRSQTKAGDVTLRVVRLMSTTPRSCSRRLTCLLTADRLTPIWRAALVKLSVEATFLKT